MPERAPSHIRHGSNIGQPLTRQDGLLKVTGAAKYAADNNPAGLAHAVLCVSSIGAPSLWKAFCSTVWIKWLLMPNINRSRHSGPIILEVPVKIRFVAKPKGR